MRGVSSKRLMSETVRARLILRSPSGDSVLEEGAEPASPATVRDAREGLIGLGFRVHAADRTGIAFEGKAERFTAHFGDPATTPLAVPDELAGVAADVVIPRTPELFP
jgi:hypothetical protein